MNDNETKNVKDWLLQQQVKNWGSLAFTTTTKQRAVMAAKELHDLMQEKNFKKHYHRILHTK